MPGQRLAHHAMGVLGALLRKAAGIELIGLGVPQFEHFFERIVKGVCAA